MRCYLKRYNEKMEKNSYFAKHLEENINHWVIFKDEARQFNNVREANWAIKHYKLKNCEVEKCQMKD